MNALTQNYEFRTVAAAAGSAGTDVNGTAVDCQLVNNVLFYTRIATANAGNYLKVQGSADGSTGWTDIAGTKATAGANNDAVMSEVKYPIGYRYYRGVIVRGGLATATEIMVSVVNREIKPPTNTLTGQVSTLTLSPAAGTP